MAKELIRDLSKIVEKAIRDTFEDKYYMDFECEGVEPTLYVEEGSGDILETSANIYTEYLWSSGARPKDKKAEKYIDVAIDSMEREIDELDWEGLDEESYLQTVEHNREYDPFLMVIASPKYYTNENGFQICDLTISMNMLSYIGANIVKYEPKTISMSTVTMNERINVNYVDESDFEFEGGGLPVDDDVIYSYVQTTIQEYVAQF